MSDMDFYMKTFEELPAVINKSQSMGEHISQMIYDYMQLQHLYDSAIEVVKTYLNIIDNEFSIKFQRNPIHNIESRLKSPQSIIGKLQKKGLPITPESAMKNLLDIAGIRVTCCYINDIYSVVDMLCRRDDFTILKQKDYIANPKPSGYRSYHIIVNVPVYLSTHKTSAPVEIQIRTIAMDFWASLEHQLKYKTSAAITPEISKELRDCADQIASTDMQMQKIFDEIYSID